MNWNPYTAAHTLEGASQTIAQGPVAALEFIENLGTNGGGFFNANNAHPHQDPTPLANLVEMLAIAVVPAALTHTFGRMVGRVREGWVLLWVMVLLFAAGLICCNVAEQRGNTGLSHAATAAGAPSQPAAYHSAYHPPSDAGQPGGNMEGKELRFYTIPTLLDTTMLLYNKTLFQQAGISGPPKTIEELTADALKLTKKDSSGHITQLGFDPLLYASDYNGTWLPGYVAMFGGTLASADGKKIIANCTACVAALQWEASLYKAVGAIEIDSSNPELPPQSTATATCS